MNKRHSEELRKIIIAFYDRGHTKAETASRYGVAPDTVAKWLRLREETGSLKPRKPRGRRSIITEEALLAYLQEHPDAYYKEIGEHFGVAQASARRARLRAGITNKKNSKIHRKRRNQEARISAKARWKEGSQACIH